MGFLATQHVLACGQPARDRIGARVHERRYTTAQLVHERIADAAIDLYVSACVLARLDHLLGAGGKSADPFADPAAGRYFQALAFRRVRQNLAALDSNDDSELLAAATSTLARV